MVLVHLSLPLNVWRLKVSSWKCTPKSMLHLNHSAHQLGRWHTAGTWWNPRNRRVQTIPWNCFPSPELSPVAIYAVFSFNRSTFHHYRWDTQPRWARCCGPSDPKRMFNRSCGVELEDHPSVCRRTHTCSPMEAMMANFTIEACLTIQGAYGFSGRRSRLLAGSLTTKPPCRLGIPAQHHRLSCYRWRVAFFEVHTKHSEKKRAVEMVGFLLTFADFTVSLVDGCVCFFWLCAAPTCR